MNPLDIVLLGVIVLAGLSGYRRGFVLQTISFAGLLIGLGLGALLAPVVARTVEAPATQALVAMVVLIVLGAAGDGVGWLIGRHLRARTRGTRFGRADAVGGSATAVVALLLAVWFVALNLVNGPFPSVAKEIRGSTIVRTLDDALPEPPSLLAQVRGFFNRFGFPDVFSGIPPLPAEPVEPPSRSEARAAFDAAVAATVRVVGQACDSIQEGSGFVAADGYIVTNAHVVAGVDEPHVQTPGGEDTGTTVLFDAELDLAILSVPGLTVAPLPLTLNAGRGDAGALLGYPEGGGLAGERAAVLRSFEAVGRDIYGEGEAERSVLELQAEVRPGNSGGPFVLPNGAVAGVIFAASTTHDDVGYALSSSEVRPPLELAVGSTAEVGTGACIR